MKSRNRIAPNNTSYNKKSRHGILTLPLCIMLPFGLLGFRPGQLFNKIIGYMINTMFLFNYGLILTITIARFYNVKDYKDTLAKFFTGFAIVMTIKFTILFYIYFKRYNFLCLLEDLTNLRKHGLSKKELLLIITTFTAIVALVIYLIYYLSYLFILPVLRTGHSFKFTFENNNPVEARATIVLEFLFFMISTWVSILATGFLVNVIYIVLRREIDKCIENLREKIKETGILSSEIFSETVDRFQELRGMVKKVDDMFFMDVVLNLCLSLGILCSSFYGINVGHFTYENMHIQVIFSMATLLITLPPSAALHTKVRVSSCFA